MANQRLQRTPEFMASDSDELMLGPGIGAFAEGHESSVHGGDVRERKRASAHADAPKHLRPRRCVTAQLSRACYAANCERHSAKRTMDSLRDSSLRGLVTQTEG